MPRELGSVSKAYRAFTEGKERGSRGGPDAGAAVVTYDRRDPEQMMEILMMGMGFTPARQAAEWEKIGATTEISTTWKLTREGLLISYFEATEGGRKDEIDGVQAKIEEFNNSLPDRAQGFALTSDTIKKSMEARAKDKAYKELKEPKTKAEAGVMDYVNKLYPSIVDIKAR